MIFVLGAGKELVRPQQLYTYTRDLLQLDSRRAPVDLSDILLDLRQIQTPLRAQEREWSLRDHPDREFCDYLLRGMTEGFRVGFRYSLCSCMRAKSNMRSTLVKPGVVEEYLKKEVGLGCVVRPISPDALPRVHMSRFGVIPNNHCLGE